MRNHPGPQETHAIAESHKEEERSRLPVAKAQLRLHDGEKGGHDDPGDKIQVKDEGQQKNGQDGKRRTGRETSAEGHFKDIQFADE
jgi:hypothetical protein